MPVAEVHKLLIILSPFYWKQAGIFLDGPNAPEQDMVKKISAEIVSKV